ncbi:hypothetical protein MMC17_004420 [Xylographa soralifera]|nr:hypothetical protein [Xylographa soralifera]
MSTTSRRPVSTVPKPPSSLSPTCIIAETASLTGTSLITVSANAVLHPRAKIIATYAPVVIGEGCIVCERASVGLLNAENDEEQESGIGVILEKNVTVEAGAVVEAKFVGEGTTIELGARIGKGAILGKHCKVTPLSVIAPGENLPDFTVAYGLSERRVEKPGLEALREKVHEKHIEVLRRLIPTNLAKWKS